MFIPTILSESTLTPARLRYWQALARKLAALPETALYAGVEYIDPDRRPLRVLREMLPDGGKVYRASTGGKWGKSAEVVSL